MRYGNIIYENAFRSDYNTMKYDTSIYRGVFCALNAIYDENDNINTDAIKALVAKYKQLGVNGIYACGSTGEGFLLSTEERMQVAEAVKEAAGDDMAVIVHVGAASTKEACILARHAEKIGVSAVSAVPSVYYRLSEASIEKHWDTIMDSTELPFFIYNIPQLTGYDLSFELFEKMSKKEKVIGIKNSSESTCQTERFRKIAGPDFVILNGPDEQLLAGRLMGATAGIGGTYGTMPELYLELTRLIETGDIENAKKMQTKINDCIYELLSFGSLYGACKAVMTLRYGLDCGIPRLPMLPVSKDDPKIKALAEKINRLVAEIKK